MSPYQAYVEPQLTVPEVPSAQLTTGKPAMTRLDLSALVVAGDHC